MNAAWLVPDDADPDEIDLALVIIAERQLNAVGARLAQAEADAVAAQGGAPSTPETRSTEPAVETPEKLHR